MIGIISINKYSVHMNYGAALHSFAFQKFLDKNGLENIIIDYYPDFMKGYRLDYPILNSINWKNLIKWSIGCKSNLKKYNKFQRFFKEQCRFTHEVYNSNTLNNFPLKQYGIDTFICESDVIWKPKSTKGIDIGYFLNFQAADSCKKISYAASVGLTMTEQEKKQIRNILPKFHAISVREKDSINFIQQLSGKNVEWVIDPTLLLTQQDYMPFVKKPKETDYLLVYNCMDNDSRMLRIARKTAEKMNLKLIEISSFPTNHIKYRHTVKTNLGIEEFLGYFAHASYIICNAFHGSCFSLVFEKNFHIFQREEYDYRLKSIIIPLGIEDKVYVDKAQNIDCLSPVCLDYNDINRKLDLYRKQSEQYLFNALKN